MENLLEQLKDSPDVVLVMSRFQEYMAEEAKKKQAFFDLVHENMKAEFINGAVVMHSPVRMKHLLVSSNLSYELNHHVKQHNLGFVGIEKMMVQFSRNCYEPDIVFFRKEVSDAFTDEQKLFPVPDLIVEILSESTQKNDYGIKFRDYEAHQVREYWIIDADNEFIEQYILKKGQYELENKLTKKGALSAYVIEGFVLELSKIFG